MGTGATVESIYSSWEMDVNPIESGFRRIIYLTQNGGHAFTDLSVKGERAFDRIQKSTSKTGNTLNDLKTKLERLNGVLGNTEVGSKRADKIIAEIRKTEAAIAKASGTIQNESDKAKASWLSLAAALGVSVAINGISNLVQGALQVSGAFEKYRAVLKNTLGDEQRAAASMQMIAKFAASTPFQVSELTSSFVKLANRGIVPTEEEMKRLGDIAASQGKSFDQITEAALDAMTGEFERLKEFGIRGSSAGDKVTLSFKGMSQTVEKSDAAIAKVILGFGKLEGVEGSMDAISKTWEGQISNLMDTVDEMKRAIGDDFADMAKLAVAAIKSVLDAVLKWRSENPALFKTIVQITIGLTGLLAAIMGAGGLIVAAKLAIPVMTSLGISFNAMLGPIGLVTMAIAGVATALLHVKNQAEETERSLKSAMDAANAEIKLTKQLTEEEMEQIHYLIEAEKQIIKNQKIDGAKYKETFNTLVSTLKDKGVIDAQLQGAGLVGTTGASIKRLNDLLKEHNRIKSESNAGGNGPGKTIKETKLSLDDLIKSYEEMDRLSAKALQFTVGFKGEEEAEASMKKLRDLGAEANKEISLGNDGKIQIEVEAKFPNGTNATAANLEKALGADSDKKPVVVKKTVEVEPKVEIKQTNLSAGVFEPLIQSLETSSDAIKEFFKTEFGQALKGGLSMIGEMGQQALAIIQAKAQLAQAKAQKIAAVSGWMQEYFDKRAQEELKRETDLIDAELEKIKEKYDAILAEEEAFQQQREEIEREYRDRKKVEEDAAFLDAIAKRQAEYESDKLAIETKQADEEQKQIDLLNLLEAFEQDKLSIKEMFEQSYEDEHQAALDNVQAQEDAAAIKNGETKKKLEEEQKKLEADKKAREEQAVKDAEERKKKFAWLEYAANLAAFNSSKVAQLAQIKMQTALGVMNAIAAGVMIASQTGLAGLVLGPASAAMLSGLIIAGGSVSAAAVASTPPPMPPVFRYGGPIVGPSHELGGVNINAEGGEFVVNKRATAQNYDTLKSINEGKSIGGNTTNNWSVNTTNQIYGMDYDQFFERFSTDLVKKISSAVAA
ncbi:hypothetical protein [Leptospira interrogans]|uniref:hypothetical protein n=1 Tax=Leptospira interrogans TaxID=173 RepID=UPI00036D8DA4|nr:hypothetical protein [Leptospira interrogans]